MHLRKINEKSKFNCTAKRYIKSTDWGLLHAYKHDTMILKSMLLCFTLLKCLYGIKNQNFPNVWADWPGISPVTLKKSVYVVPRVCTKDQLVLYNYTNLFRIVFNNKTLFFKLRGIETFVLHHPVLTRLTL